MGKIFIEKDTGFACHVMEETPNEKKPEAIDDSDILGVVFIDLDAGECFVVPFDGPTKEKPTNETHECKTFRPSNRALADAFFKQ